MPKPKSTFRPPRLLPVTLVAGALALLAGGGWLGYRWVLHSSRFALRDVVVTGNTHVTRDEILRRARLAPGVNLFRLSLADVETRIATNPWIRRVSASRSLPDKVLIAVSERAAAAQVMVDGGVYLADADGRLFKRAAVDAGEGEGVVVVSGLDRRQFGVDPDAAAALVRRALEIAAAWGTGDDRPAIGEVHLDREGITLYTLAGAIAVLIGRPASSSELSDVTKRFDAVWSALSPEERAAARAIHIDSRTRPDRVTVALSGSQR
jgi:POTRA domain-containing FtsQ-type protein/cell division protein FtsQ